MKPDVLIVDDQEINRRILEVALTNLAEFRLANDGVEALDAMGERRPDIVFLDLMMPHLDGFGVLEALRGKDDDLLARTYVVSALTDVETRERLEGLGIAGFIAKPIRLREVHDAYDTVFPGLRKGASAATRDAA